MKRLLIAIALIFTACSTVVAQENNPSGEPLYSKPVPCGGLPSLILEFEKSNMYPIMGLGGYSWTEDGNTQASVTLIIIDENGRYAVVEKNASFFCLLSTGNVVEYNSDKLKELMEWE